MNLNEISLAELVGLGWSTSHTKVHYDARVVFLFFLQYRDEHLQSDFFFMAFFEERKLFFMKTSFV